MYSSISSLRVNAHAAVASAAGVAGDVFTPVINSPVGLHTAGGRVVVVVVVVEVVVVVVVVTSPGQRVFATVHPGGGCIHTKIYPEGGVIFEHSLVPEGQPVNAEPRVPVSPIDPLGPWGPASQEVGAGPVGPAAPAD